MFFSSAPTARSWRRRPGQAHRVGRVAARRGAAGSGPSPGEHPHHRVVAARCGWRGRAAGRRRPGRPGARRASSLSVAMGSSLRLPLVITSGRAARRRRQQQVVQRRVGQHHAQVALPGRHARGELRRRAAAPAARWAAAATPAAPRSPASTTQCRSTVARSGTITAKGLSTRRLRSRRRAHGGLVGGVAGQVEAAQALDGQDLPRRQQPRAHGVAGRRRRSGDRAVPAAARPPARRAARRPGRLSAGRGSGGRAGRRTRAAQSGHMREGAPWWCWAGRRGCRR